MTAISYSDARVCKKPILSLSTFVFYTGLVTIPFDNLLFAPSSGWATVSPIIFFVYACLNARELARVSFSRKCGGVFLLLILVQLANLFIHGLITDALMDGLRTFVLGVFFYFALIIRYDTHADRFNSDAKLLYRAYLVSFIYGVVWLFAFELYQPLLELFQNVERRYYARLAFSFTEPSFISVHVFGVLFLFTYFVSDRKLAKKMIVLGLLFVLLAVATRSSTRMIMDAGVFLLLFLIRSTCLNRKHSMRNAFFWILAFAIIDAAIVSSSRVQSILLGGFNGDGSAASRFFRIESMAYGFMVDPLATLFGYGPGNMIIPFREGYDQALATYTNSWTKEVTELGTTAWIGNIFSMPVRLISDFGLIGMIAITAFFIVATRKKKLDPFVILMIAWLYVQFDSYAFYSAWILLFLARAYDEKTMGTSFYAVMDSLFDRRRFKAVEGSSRRLA